MEIVADGILCRKYCGIMVSKVCGIYYNIYVIKLRHRYFLNLIIQIYRVICRLYSHLLRLEENYDGKYGIKVFVVNNSQYLGITVWTVYCPLLAYVQ